MERYPVSFHGISIHSLRMEGDVYKKYAKAQRYIFQSTPSAWRETLIPLEDILHHCISIHSLRMEGDGYPVVPVHVGRHISIHSLRMEGDSSSEMFATMDCVFQSTPSAWRETTVLGVTDVMHHISIHSLRMEGDPESRQNACRAHGFQSTPSAWRETIGERYPVIVLIFQSTPSAWRETF